MVARLLTSKEVNHNPKALQAILEEGENLLKQGVWDVTSAREKRDVIRDAMRLNKKVYFARILKRVVKRYVLKRVVNCPKVILTASSNDDA